MRGPIIVLLASCAFAACTADGWTDVPGAAVRPESRVPGVSDDTWGAVVAEALLAWDDGLGARGCPVPFSGISDDGHAVRLLPRSEWHWGPAASAVTTPDGTWTRGSTEVLWFPATAPSPERLRDATLATVIHELGHGIGLGHADPTFGPAIMTPSAGAVLTARDIDAAACFLGCGTCDIPDRMDDL